MRSNLRAGRKALAAAGLALGALAGACAARGLPPMPDALRHPDFVYPAVPESLRDPRTLGRHEGGWRYLQAGNPGRAEQEFRAVLRARPGFFPAEVGLGWVELARGAAEPALLRFDGALGREPAYVPALVGRGYALLALGRDAEALAAFEGAIASGAVLPEVEQRVGLLRLRRTQASIAEARAAAAAGRWDEARAAYETALAASPGSAFLVRELAAVERDAGRLDVALARAQEAVAADPGDPAAHVLLAELLDARGDHDAAVAAYERALAIEGSPELDRALGAARERAEFARLPPAYAAIRETPAITRGELAAVLGVRLAALLERAPSRQLVLTDVRGHWAQRWIVAVARAGILEAYPNYTFQPAQVVRRGDLAVAVGRALDLMAAARPDLVGAWRGARPAVADVPTGHLSYPAVAAAVASGVMPLDGAGAFHLLRPVSGAEAFEVVARLAALAGR